MKQIVTLYDVLRKAQDSGILQLLENANCTRTNYSEWLIIYETYLHEFREHGNYGAIRRTVETLGGDGGDKPVILPTDERYVKYVVGKMRELLSCNL